MGDIFSLSLVGWLPRSSSLPGGGCEVQVIVDQHQVHHNHLQITDQWQLKNLEQDRGG